MRRANLAVAVFVSLLVLAGLAAAATYTGTVSEHSTEADFESDEVDLVNMTIRGGGDDAQVGALPRETGSSISMSRDLVGTQTSKTGIVIQPNVQLSGLELTHVHQDNTILYIVDHDTGEELWSTSIADTSETSVDIRLDAGAEYRLLVDADGELYSEWRPEENAPISSPDFDITTGYDNGETTSILHFKEVTALKGGSVATYQGEHNVVEPENGVVNVTNVDNAEGTLEWDYHDGSEWVTISSDQVTSEGVYESDISGYSSTDYRITITSSQVDGSSTWDFEIGGERLTAETHTPEVTAVSPADGDQIDSGSVELKADVSDGDFTTARGDNVTISFYDGEDELIDQQSITSDQTVTTTWDGLQVGHNEWYAVAEDDYGGEAETETQSFTTPSEVVIRDEVTEELIDSQTEVVVRFFRTDSDQVITRTASDGSVDMEGLPVEEEFIVEARSDGYYTRYIYIESIFDQSTIYLLDEDEDALLTELRIRDRTNNYPGEETRLIVEKPMGDDDGVATYTTIAGDQLGGDGRFAVYLAADDRYRIAAENDDGDRRSLGTYRADREGLVDLEIGTINIEAPGDRGFAFNARMADAEEHGENTVRITYNDPGGETDQLRYWIHDRNNESDIVYDEVQENDLGQYSALIEVPENGTHAVSWEADRGGETWGGSEPIGSVRTLDIPVSGTLLQTLGMTAVVLLAGLFGGRMSRTGALVIVVVAWALSLFGIVVIPYPFLVAAGIVAVLFKVGEGSGGGVPA